MSSPRHQSSAFAHGHPRRSLCSSLPISAFTSAQLRATLAVAVIVLACRTGPLDKNLFDLLQNLVTDRQSWEDVNEAQQILATPSRGPNPNGSIIASSSEKQGSGKSAGGIGVARREPLAVVFVLTFSRAGAEKRLPRFPIPQHRGIQIWASPIIKSADFDPPFTACLAYARSSHHLCL